jgi:hypothetical protein
VTLPPELLQAYRSTHYAVFGEPELVLRIGEKSAALDALLEARGGKATAAFITAANPRSREKPDAENAIAAAALRRSLSDAGYDCMAGEGRDPEGKWKAEKSVLVLGMTREDALALARALDQNAIVFVERGKAPELVVL